MSLRSSLGLLLLAPAVLNGACTDMPFTPRVIGVTSTNLNLRAQPNATAAIVVVIPRNTALTVRGTTGTWLAVNYGTSSGFVASRYVDVTSTVISRPTPQLPGGARGLLPVQQRILEQAGWLSYVRDNLDAVEYIDRPALGQTADGYIIGLSFVRNGFRVAQVAAQGRSDEQIAVTLAHEAAHAAPFVTTGSFANEDVARAVEAQFLRDLNNTRRSN